MEQLWVRLGIAAAKVADNVATGGLLTLLYHEGSGLYRTVAERQQPGLKWNLDYERAYSAEIPNLLRISDPGIGTSAIPQVPLFLPEVGFDPAEVALELLAEDHRPAYVNETVLRDHKKRAGQKMFFDGENARLVRADGDAFVFQGCRYFDYIGTNLALDHEDTIAGTLRRQIHGNTALEPLAESPLANATGVNGLVFTRDGQLVLQKRNSRVLVRPNEICSGFSGTIDRADIGEAILRGGKLSDLNATRELFEEVGIPNEAIGVPRFLGVTRELIRGGKPEMFYSVDVQAVRREFESYFPRDREGALRFVPLGMLGRSTARLPPEMSIIELLKRVAGAVDGRMSLPLLTNLVLWHRACRAG